MRHDSMTNLRIRNPSGATVSLGSRFAGLSTVFILLFLTGCASVGTPRLSANKESAEQQLRGDMVADLLSVLPQILEPLNTTIQVSDTESGDADNAMSRLVELGYGLQRVNADQGNHFLYLVELPAVTAESRSDTRLRLAVGDLEFTRSYRIMRKDKNLDRANLIWRGGQAVVPTGPMKVAGTRQTLVLDGIDIEIASNTEGSKGEQGLVTGSVEFAALAPIDGGIPSISLITDDIVQQVAKTASAGPSLASLNAHNDNFGNLFNGGASAYASVLDNYDRVAREFVIFPNDSQFLGKPGKLVVKKLINRFSENTDIVGIIGCSNGATSLAIGNEGLALGRAQRIADELVAAGISREKVFDEGCWSPEADAPGFPNRGVVIDLWRRT